MPPCLPIHPPTHPAYQFGRMISKNFTCDGETWTQGLHSRRDGPQPMNSPMKHLREFYDYVNNNVIMQNSRKFLPILMNEISNLGTKNSFLW